MRIMSVHKFYDYLIENKADLTIKHEPSKLLYGVFNSKTNRHVVVQYRDLGWYPTLTPMVLEKLAEIAHLPVDSEEFLHPFGAFHRTLLAIAEAAEEEGL